MISDVCVRWNEVVLSSGLEFLGRFQQACPRRILDCYLLLFLAVICFTLLVVKRFQEAHLGVIRYLLGLGRHIEFFSQREANHRFSEYKEN